MGAQQELGFMGRQSTWSEPGIIEVLHNLTITARAPEINGCTTCFRNIFSSVQIVSNLKCIFVRMMRGKEGGMSSSLGRSPRPPRGRTLFLPHCTPSPVASSPVGPACGFRLHFRGDDRELLSSPLFQGVHHVAPGWESKLVCSH